MVWTPEPCATVYNVYQITAVGSTRYQAEWVADQCREVMLGDTLTVTGRTVMRRMPLSSGPVERDDDMPTPLFYTVSTFQVWTTPRRTVETITEGVGVTDNVADVLTP